MIFKIHFFSARCENVGKPKRAGCGKRRKNADRKTYYGENKKTGQKKNRETGEDIIKRKSRGVEMKKVDLRVEEGKRNRKTDDRITNKKGEMANSGNENRQTDNEMTKQKRRTRTDNKSSRARIENVVEKPRWVLV